MKKLIGIIFILSCFLNPNLDAASKKSFSKKISKSFPRSQNKNKSKSYLLKNEFFDESFQVIFPEEPSELLGRFNGKVYQAIVSGISGIYVDEDDEDGEDDEDDYEALFYSSIDYNTLISKEFHFFLTLDEGGENIHFLSASKLQKSQDQVEEAISTLMADWKKYCVSENEEDMDEEHHFEYTPMKKDENGHYMAELFYSSIYGDEDDDVEEEYAWGKIVITKKNLYYLTFRTNKNNVQINDQASEFLSSFKVNKD